MPDGPHHDIERFEVWVKPLLPYYPSLEVRALAYENQGVLWNIYSTLTVTPEPRKSSTPKTVKAHPRFRIWRQVLPSESLPNVLRDLRKEELHLPNVAVKLATPSNQQAQHPAQARPPMWWHGSRDWADASFWGGNSPTGGGVSTYLLSSNSGETNALVPREEMEELHDALLRCRPRWLGLPDLLRRFIGAEEWYTFSHNTTFRVSLPLNCLMGVPYIEQPNSLTVPLAAPYLLPPSKLKIAALLTAPSGKGWEGEAVPCRNRLTVPRDGSGQP
jgi:hypothetical protein